MEFFIETQELQKIVNQLGVSAKANATDNSGRILVEVSKSEGVLFTVVGPSTSLTIVAEKVDIMEEGSVALLYSKLKSSINPFISWDGETGTKGFQFKLTGSDLIVKVKTVHIGGKASSGRIKFDTFQTYTIAKPAAFNDATFTLNSNMLKTAIGKVLYSINPAESRIPLRGMCLTFSDNKIAFAGTDGMRLSEYITDNTTKISEGTYIISHDYIMGIRRLLSEETHIAFAINDGKIATKFDNITYWGKLIIGHDYPIYEKEFAKFNHTLLINKEVLMNSLRPFMGILNAEDHNRLTLDINDHKLTLYNDYANFVCAEELEVDANLSIDLNGVFIAQTIDAINDDKLLLKFSNAKGSLIIDGGTFGDQKSLVTYIEKRT
ncbi:MAG TPA: DNA polymerase III subunit beta [Patescibacteria group bacterium]|nr:DNA polymerase III subunit beta [Patescibacteria group bacterium]